MSHSRVIVVGALVMLSTVATATGNVAETPRLALLPLQDRAGDLIAATVVGNTSKDELGLRFEIVAAEQLRDALRRERVRDAGEIEPVDLHGLARELNVDLFVSLTVHRVTAAPEPQITLSAWAHRAMEKAPVWFGFRSASGLDTRRALGVGQIDEIERLAFDTTRELLAELMRALAEGPPAPGKTRAFRGGYRVDGLTRASIGTIAIVPFESIADRDSTIAGETLTAVARAALYRQGVTIGSPGAVNATLRRRGLYGRGELDTLGRAALKIAAGADTILTGTVEVYEPAVSLDPNPRVAYSMRLIDVDTGEILWIGALDRTAEDGQKFFGRKRTYNAGGLAMVQMESLVAGMLGSEKR